MDTFLKIKRVVSGRILQIEEEKEDLPKTMSTPMN
jgi:hypothetical protein